MAENVTYAKWLEIADDVKKNGLNATKYELLYSSYPHYLDENMIIIFFNQIVELEKKVLTDSFSRFEKELNEALNEGDMNGIDLAMTRYVRNVSRTMFFQEYTILGKQYIDELYNSIVDNIKDFQNQLDYYLKRLSMEVSGTLIEDILYIVRKKNPVKMISRWRQHE